MTDRQNLLGSRQGASRIADVTRELREHLESGGQSRTHIEQMAISFGPLADTILPQLHPHYREKLDEGSFFARMKMGAHVVWEALGPNVFDVAHTWQSDTCRGWAAFAIPLSGEVLSEQLSLARRFARDDHFAVREWAWLGVRPTVCLAPEESIAELFPWTASQS